MSPAPASLLRAARRTGCAVVASTMAGTVPVSRVLARDSAHAAQLLAALAEEDAELPAIVRTAERLAGMHRTREAYARAVQRFVQKNVAFVRERGERFARADLTIAARLGDCDDHARVVLALLIAGDVPGRLATLHRGGGPASHVVAQALLGGAWRWLETTVPADFDEPPHAAAVRTGATRRDISDAPEARPVEIPMNPNPIDPKRPDSAIPLLRRAGYLPEREAAPSPTELRAAAVAFQKEANERGWATLVVDGKPGPLTRGALARVLLTGLGDLGAADDDELPPPLQGLTKAFFYALQDASETLRIPVNVMLNVMQSESGINPKAGYNDGKNRASGLNQIVPLRAFGFPGTHDDYLKLSAAQQMPYVVRCWLPWAGTTDPVTLYQGNFLPATMGFGRSDDTVLVRQGGDRFNGQEANFYAVNRSLDRNKDGTITRGDLRQVLAGAATAARYKAAVDYAQRLSPRTSIALPPLVGVPLVLVGLAKLLPLLAAKAAAFA